MQPHDQPVLIIEDDFVVRYALARLIQQSGRRALGVPTLAAGMALLETEPECVVLDLTLPDGQGEELLRMVRERHIPCRVVVCSGVADPQRLEAVKGLAPDALLTKPVVADQFLSAFAAPPAPTCF